MMKSFNVSFTHGCLLYIDKTLQNQRAAAAGEEEDDSEKENEKERMSK